MKRFCVMSLLLFSSGAVCQESPPVFEEVNQRPCQNRDPVAEAMKNGKKKTNLAAYRKACEGKLGPIPKENEIMKSSPIVLRLNGKPVDRNPKDGVVSYLEKDGKRTPVEKKYLDATGALNTCDNPSLAAFSENPCHFGERLVRFKTKKAGVYWVGVQRNNPDTLGLIGWNEKTGASCFFPSSPPGKGSQTLHAGAPGSDNCLRCHTQSDPFVVTPNVREAWDALDIPRQMQSFKDGEYQFHVPGIEHSGLQQVSRIATIHGKDGKENTTCTQCHQVTLSDSYGAIETFRSALGTSTGFAGQHMTQAHAWMPRDLDKNDPEVQQALSALDRYARGLGEQPADGSTPEVKETQPFRSNCPSKLEGIEISTALARPSKEGMELRWKGKGVSAEKMEGIRYEVSASFEFESGDDGQEYIGAGDWMACNDLKSSGTSRVMESKHSLPKRPVKSIQYFITPMWIDPKFPDCPPVKGEKFHYEYLPPVGERHKKSKPSEDQTPHGDGKEYKI